MIGRTAVLIVLTLLSAAPSAAAAERVNAYLLTPDERTQLRGLVGGSTNMLVWDMAKSLQRIAADIGGATRNPYLGRRSTFAQAFRAAMGGPPNNVEIESDRFVFASACRFHSCPEKGALVIDLVSGHAVLALLHYLDAKGLYREQGYLTFARKTCIDAAFARYAETRLDRWIRNELRGSTDAAGNPEGPLRSTVETPCRPTAPRPEALVEDERIKPDTRPLFRLTGPEITSLRSLVGQSSKTMMDADPGWRGYRRVFNATANKKGHYSGDPDLETASVWDFYLGIASDAPVRLIDNRFVLFGGCSADSHCGLPALAIVDVRTGNLVVAIVHRFDIRGTLFYEDGHATMFLASCVDAELAAFAKRFVPGWAREHAVRAFGAVPDRLGAPTTVTTRCR
jgi:hypothetical protein